MAAPLARVLFVDSGEGPPIEPELNPILSEQCTVTVISRERPRLPYGDSIDWIALPRSPAALLAHVRQARPDFAHAHGKLETCLGVRLAASVLGARYCADFNDIRILLRNRQLKGSQSWSVFEQAAHWERALTPTEQSRIETVLSVLPQPIDTLLDVGCGDGRVTNQLLTRARHVVGLDASEKALSYVRAETRQSSVDRLPFSDGSFQMVTCIQVLEHLPREVLERTLSELRRVASRYILVGVPLREPLHYRNLNCAACGHRFNQTGHLHRFTERSVRRLFPGWRLSRLETCGAERRVYYNRLLMFARREFGGGNVRTANGHCPACGIPTWVDQASERNLITQLCDRYNGKIQRRLQLGRSHLVALFERP